MKTVSIISIVYGVLGLIWGTLLLAILRFETALISNIPFPAEVTELFDVKKMLHIINDIWSVLFPFIILIAVTYLVSGILGMNDRPHAVTFGLLAAAFNITWYIAYIVIMQVELIPMIDFGDLFPKKLFHTMFILGMLINAVFYCGYPVFLIIFLSRKRKATG